MAINWMKATEIVNRLAWIMRDLSYKAPEERPSLGHEPEFEQQVMELLRLLPDRTGTEIPVPTGHWALETIRNAISGERGLGHEVADNAQDIVNAVRQLREDRMGFKFQLEALREKDAGPIPMRLPCPRCGELHVDVAFKDKVHHTHACQHCGEVWRPAVVATVGVRFLPGFKDETLPERLPGHSVRRVDWQTISTRVPLLDPDFKREVLEQHEAGNKPSAYVPQSGPAPGELRGITGDRNFVAATRTKRRK